MLLIPIYTKIDEEKNLNIDSKISEIGRGLLTDWYKRV